MGDRGQARDIELHHRQCRIEFAVDEWPLQTVAGVQANVFEGRLRIDPLATPLYRRLRVEGMRVGDGSLDFTVDMREGGQPRVKVDRKPRDLKLVEQPA